ncbi:MAG: hypothetical protein HY067_19220 [Betaproteobacteria bacterium]|nr:hypothetical protein [Betaproteobacteria bacterium]
MIIDRQPWPLYSILQNNGYAYRETFKPEGIFEILIWRARWPHGDCLAGGPRRVAIRLKIIKESSRALTQREEKGSRRKDKNASG